MLNVNIYIRNRITGFLGKKGVVAEIGHVNFKGLSGLSLEEVSLSYKGYEGQSVRFNRIVVYISLWRSLLHFAIEGEVKFSETKIDVRAISDIPFFLPSGVFTFRFRTKFWIGQMEAENIHVSMQFSRNKQYSDFYIEMQDVVWNNLIDLLRNHLLSEFIAGSYSDSKISLFCYFKRDKSQSMPIFKTKIKWDGFQLQHRDEKGEGYTVPINRAFLMDVLDKKLGIVRQNMYVHFEQLPGIILKAIVCSEDPRFWKHSGVCPYGVGMAIRDNMRDKKIVRGASTITMQLARNLFLTHSRNFLRKTEEIAIALLLENYYKISKETIIELYLNLIEFAPGIYGIQRASRFYFGKNCDELTLTEIFVLTYIIPRPIHFYEALKKKTEQLRNNLRTHVEKYYIGLLRREMISQEDLEKADYQIHFSQEFGMLDLRNGTIVEK